MKNQSNFHPVVRYGCIPALALPLIFAGWLWRVSSQAEYWQMEIGQPLEKQLGFEVSTPYIKIDGVPREILVIIHVEPGGAFGKSGVIPGDIPVKSEGEKRDGNGFFKKLEHARGGTAVFEVVAGGHGEELDKRPRRTIRVPVPAAAP